MIKLVTEYNELIILEEKKKINFKKIYIATLCISIFMVITCSVIFLIWNDNNRKTKKLQNEIISDTVINTIMPSDTTNTNIENVNPPATDTSSTTTDTKPNDYWYYLNMPLISVDFSTLMSKNKDTVAWLQVSGTSINYPVVQSTNNSKYLKISYDGKPNGAGWVFADYRDNFKDFGINTIIYGHGRLDTIMFGTLKNIIRSNWYNNKANHIIKLSTPTANTLWQVFSVYSIPKETFYLTTDFYGNTDEHKKFLETLKNRSYFSFSADVDVSDKIITLSTCDDNNTNRIVMHAKLIKKETRK